MPYNIRPETLSITHIFGSRLSFPMPLAIYGARLRTKIIENKIQFEVQNLDYPCRNLVI